MANKKIKTSKSFKSSRNRTQKSRPGFLSNRRAGWLGALLFVILFGGLGVHLYQTSHAATAPTILDATSMTADRNAALAANPTNPQTNCNFFPSAQLCSASNNIDTVNTGTVASTDSGADASGTPCTDSGCGPLSYHGGAVLHNPNIYIVDWGPKWKTDTTLTTPMDRLIGGIGVESYPSAPDKWSSTLSQYYDQTGAHWTYNSTTSGPYIDPSTPPANTSGAQIAAEVAAFAKQENIAPSDYFHSLIVVTAQQGTCMHDFSMCGHGGICGGHSWTNVTTSGSTHVIPFVILPYYPDTTGCTGSQPAGQEYTAAAGHEIAEAITDPEVGSWYRGSIGPGGGEIADECAGSIKGLSWKDGTVYMQPLYSNAAGGCVYSSGVQGQLISHSGYCLDDYYSGVGDNNKIDTWGCNQTGAQMVTKYPDGTLRILGRCVIDPSGGGSGTQVVLFPCNGKSQQSWSYDKSSGEYKNQANGLCLRNTPNGQPYGAQLTVYGCDGNNNQNWSLPL